MAAAMMPRVLPWAVAPATAAIFFAVMLGHPGADERWESHPAHFWLVLAAASASVGLGSAVSAAARRRRDARLFLISLAFVASAGFLGLHALATPGVLLGKNAGFELLAEAMLVIAWARNWRLSWWEWHVLMLSSFLVIATAARTEWHEERYAALYLDRTLAGARDVSIILADLSGFTSFSELHTPTEVAAMLNAYFEAIVPRMQEARGEVHQIVGDELMVIFNKQGDTED